MPCWQQDSLIWQVLESIHKFIIELHIQQCLFVRGPIKNKGGVVLFHILQKERLFHLLWQTSALEDNLTMWSSFFHPPKKAFLSPSVWPRREYIWTFNWKDNLLIFFENCLGVSCSHRQSRSRMMNTFIISYITSICER